MKKQQVCMICGRVIIDRTGYKSPNLRRHVRACEAKREAAKKPVSPREGQEEKQ